MPRTGVFWPISPDIPFGPQRIQVPGVSGIELDHNSFIHARSEGTEVRSTTPSRRLEVFSVFGWSYSPSIFGVPLPFLYAYINPSALPRRSAGRVSGEAGVELSLGLWAGGPDRQRQAAARRWTGDGDPASGGGAAAGCRGARGGGSAPPRAARGLPGAIGRQPPRLTEQLRAADQAERCSPRWRP